MGIFGDPPKPAAPVQPETEEFCDLPPLPEPPNTTVIAEGIVISGKLHGEGIVEVKGTIEGEIDLRGLVVVTACGMVKGPVSADAVHAAGLIEGDITAYDHMRLEKSGIVSGDITTASFVIEEGGWLNGRTTMNKPQKEIPSAGS